MKIACVVILSIIELKNARWNIETKNYIGTNALNTQEFSR